MSWWNNSLETKLFDDEAYFRDRYPKHIARAFIAVNYDDRMPILEKEHHYRPYHELVTEAIQSFTHRWGRLDDNVFVQVLQQATGRDRLVAIFALGQSELLQAADLLAPFLTSSDFLERCASAIALGFRRDERALPALEEYLLTDVPTQEIEVDQVGSIRRPLPEAELWYKSYRAWIVRVLATWGPASMTSTLRTIFLNLWGQESEKWRRDYTTLDALLYALGRRGALAALHGILLPDPYLRLAMIYLALGKLGADERFDDLYVAMLGKKELQEEVALVLAEHFALSEQDIQEAVSSFGIDHFE